ncbi:MULTISPECIES: copper amine oxidase N-terminal domain-containing protein [Paenibacillus]|uniref:Copper amine oxidase N-terminal domain-containing protein n=1 Tax=Paenibacillus polymyxa TaxID=1406 RepID=A0AAP4A1I5_PAEPO|nr:MULTISPECIES: copper amine oxidase N-terminal domain-containing protein [Paenibacillus]APB73765.1 peptidylprolyl isomerase [Paenibacillus polymyxa]MDH2331260.1 copper amine oxidase N-terminal domain-containing protein [Paenibacillus polymyxa]ODB59470.1 peptidylprolyl isomerase [Paenibacillus polymyxa]OMF80599.1 peptidylprolyl isomerase [Paenibacillus peoriae]POR29062.1 peptidylprolyl isomerase [Paenibacillus polymyxa]
MKIRLLVCLMIVLSFATTNSNLASAQDHTPIHLKVNDHYVLYTYPASPFVDKKGRLLIPLQVAEDILGGKVTYNAANKTASVDLLDRNVTATIGSPDISVNGEPMTMDTVPIMLSNAMFLPVSILLKDTDAKMEWDSKRGLLKLRHDSFTESPVLMRFKGQDLAQVIDANAFDLISFDWDQRQGVLNIHATYKSDLSPAFKQIDFNPMIVYSKGTYTVDPYSKPGSFHKVKITSHGHLVYTMNIDTIDADNDYIKYITSVGRLIK